MTEAKLAPNMPKWMVDHTNLYLSSGGKQGHMYTIKQPDRPELSVPSLLLTTKGRKSGEKYIFPLFYGKSGNSYFIVASKGGAPDHPGWYKNLDNDPEVELQVKDEIFRARARTASGEERERLWRKANEVWPHYDEYATRTERQIPVVVLERI
jgi:proline iminopeptidase